MSVYLSSTEVAHRLGLAPVTVRRLVNREGLPAHRVARRLRFNPEEVDAWMQAREGAHSTSAENYRATIRRLVDEAPPLTSEQRDRIAAILSGGREVVL